MRIGVVVFELEVFILEIEDALHLRIDAHHRQGSRRTRELQPGLVEMVQIEMSIARGMDEVAGLQPRHLCHHLEEQGIRSDVEGYPKEGVSRALVELQAQTSVGHIKLEHRMARG